MKRTYLLIILFLFISTDVFAQIRFAGLSFSGVYTMNNSTANGFPGFTIDDISFSPSNTVNIDLNVFAEYDFYDGFFTGLEFGYYQPELKYSGNEFIKFIIDKILIDGTITHDVNVSINWLYPAVFIGYRYKSVSITAGNKFNFVIASGYEHNQAITEPDSMIFINPGAQNYYDDADINPIVYMPFVRFTYDLGRDLFPSSLFDAQLDLEYSLNINPILPNYDYKLSNIKLGINLGFNITGATNKVVILRDTVYQRDTLTVYSFNVTKPTITRISRLANTKRERRGDVWHYSTTIAEQYNLELPKPAPLLNGELRTVFIEKDSREVQECVMSLSKQIIIRRYPTLKNHTIQSSLTRDTITYSDIPSVRFYPSVISEAGLDSMIISLYADGKLLTEVVSADEQQEFVEINLEELIKNNANQSLDYKLTLVDVEGQKKTVAKGNIILKSKISDVYNITELFYIDLKSDFTEIMQILKSLNASQNNLQAYYPADANVQIQDKIKKIKEKYPQIFRQEQNELNIPALLDEKHDRQSYYLILWKKGN